MWVELGTGKGNFISRLADIHREVNFIGIEVQLGVLYYAAKKCAAAELTNVRLLRFDAAFLETLFAPGEVDRFFINFCDPWPKKRHAKRRLTYRGFLDRYARLLAADGKIHFKSDNAGLFDFTLEEFNARHWPLSEVTYDLHGSDILNEAMTEYEAKFSGLGQPIFHCVAAKPAKDVDDNNKKAKQMYRAMLLLLGAFALLWVIGTVNVFSATFAEDRLSGSAYGHLLRQLVFRSDSCSYGFS